MQAITHNRHFACPEAISQQIVRSKERLPSTTLPPCLFLRDAAVPGLWALWVLIGAALAHSCHKKTGDPLECPVCGEFSGTPHRRPLAAREVPDFFGYTHRQPAQTTKRPQTSEQPGKLPTQTGTQDSLRLCPKPTGQWRDRRSLRLCVVENQM